MRVPILMIVALAGTPAAVSPSWAQRLSAHVPSAVQAQDQSGDPRFRLKPPVGSVIGAIVGGTAGFFAGALVASQVVKGCRGEWCGLEGVAFGALVGEALGLGVGAHLGNGARGRWWAPMAASAAVLLVSGIVANEAELPGEALIVVPVAQIVAAVVAESATARRARGR